MKTSSTSPAANPRGRVMIPSGLSVSEMENRIAILRGNIRQLIEQAAAQSGAGDDARISDRIADQTKELEELIAARDALVSK